MNISFGGATIKRPGAYSTVDTEGMTPVTLGASNVLAYAGAMDATATLEPFKAFYFNDPSEAGKKLKQGEFLDMLKVAWKHGADLIAVVRADQAVQASGNLNDVTPVPVIKLAAKSFGTDGNAIQYSLVTPTLTIKNATVTETYTITGKSNQVLVAEINANSKLVTASKLLDTVPTTPAVLTSMTLGAGGAAPTDVQWQQAIDVLNTEFVDGIVPVSVSAAIQSKVDAHITNMSSVTNRRERRAFYGHAAGLDVTAIAGLQAAINNERGLMASPEVYDYDASGNKVLRDSHYLASAIAGIWASQPPQEPVTYKYVKFAGLGKIYSATDIGQLLDAHICPVEYVRNEGYRIVQGVTLSSSADLTKQELSVSTLKDVMSGNIRTYMEKKHVGHAGVKGIEVTIYNDLVTLIEGFGSAGWISGYVAESLKVTKNGTAFTLDWEAQPTLPINNFLITSHFTL